jgi:hypothetical protein
MSIKALRKALAAPDRWFARATWTPADFDDAGYSAAPRAYIAAACTAAPALLARCDALAEAARQALEALESLQGGCTDSDDGTAEAITVWCPEVVDALRAAIATQESDK